MPHSIEDLRHVQINSSPLLPIDIKITIYKYNKVKCIKSLTNAASDGEMGAGKSLTIAHLLHYAHENGFLIVHVPWGKF